MLNKGVEGNSIKGLGAFNNGIISLQYADDTILFLEANERYLRNLKLFLALFERVSGLRINFSKSEVFWLGGDEFRQELLAEFFNCKSGKFPIKYLGIPLKNGRLTKSEWMPLVDKVESSLPNWKGRCLSRGGRLVLINSVLSSIPLYWMSFYRLPAWVVNKIDKIRRAFFWNGQEKVTGIKCLRKWNVLCKSKKQGGLGIINIHLQNIALLGKWIWKLLLKENNLWVRFIRFKFFRRRNIYNLTGNLIQGASSFFKEIWKSGTTFKLGLIKECGEGKKVLFWKDLWLDHISLERRFPSLFSVAAEPLCSVKSQYKVYFGVRVWNIKFTALFDDSHIKEYEELMMLINSYSWKDSGNFIWRWNKSGKFSVKTYYKFLNDGGLLCPLYKFIWQPLAPLKVRILLWLVKNNCLLTGSILRIRHLNIERMCVFCNTEEDDLDHIFLKCHYTQFLWRFFINFFVFTHLPVNLEDWFGNWRISNINDLVRNLWDTLMLAFIWVLWKERNTRIFDNKSNNKYFIFNSILFFVDFWTGSLQEPLRNGISASDLLKVGVSFMVEEVMPSLPPSVDLIGAVALDVGQCPPAIVESRSSLGTVSHLITYRRRRRRLI